MKIKLKETIRRSILEEAVKSLKIAERIDNGELYLTDFIYNDKTSVVDIVTVRPDTILGKIRNIDFDTMEIDVEPLDDKTETLQRYLDHGCHAIMRSITSGTPLETKEIINIIAFDVR